MPPSYAGRELHAGLNAAEGETVETIELQSATLGLLGKVDAVRRRDGSRVPYEHKRGRCRRDENGAPTAGGRDA
jgi:CRISPR-associated protein Cas1